MFIDPLDEFNFQSTLSHSLLQFAFQRALQRVLQRALQYVEFDI